MRKPDELRLYAALRGKRGPIPWRDVEAAAIAVDCNVKRAYGLFQKWTRKDLIIPLTGGGVWSMTAPLELQADVNYSCPFNEWDHGTAPCGSRLCEHRQCQLHWGCDTCRATLIDEIAQKATEASRIYGGATVAFSRADALRHLIEGHTGPMAVIGVDPAHVDMSSVTLGTRHSQGGRVLVVMGGRPVRFFVGDDLHAVAERFMPSLTQAPPVDRLGVRIHVNEPPSVIDCRCTLGPSGYGWCNPPYRPTTIDSPIPRPVVPSPWLVVRRAGMQGKGTPKGWGAGKGAYRHGVGSRRDIGRMKRQVRLRAIVARIARGAGMFQVNHALV